MSFEKGIEKTDSFKKLPLLNSQFTVINKTIYISSGNYNGLYAIDIYDGELKLIGKFTYQGSFDTSLFLMKNYNKKLLFIPLCAREIAIYDIEKKQIEETMIKYELSTYSIAMSTCAVWEEEIYLFPAKADSIIIYNMVRQCIKESINIANIYTNTFREGYSALAASDSSYIYEDKVYIPCWTQPAFMSLDFNTKKIQFHTMNELEQGFCSLCGYGNYVYALNRCGVLIKWDISSGKVLLKEKIIADRNNVEYYRAITIIDEHIYLHSTMGILRMVKTNLELQIESEGVPQGLLDMLKEIFVDEIVYFGCFNQDKLYCYTDKNRYLCIDMLRETVEWIRDILFDFYQVKKDIFDETKIIEKNYVFRENDAISIEELIELTNKSQEKLVHTQSCIGEKIYRISL